MRKEKRLQKGEVVLLLFYVLLFVDFILSFCWGGFAPTGGGKMLPDSQALIPMIFFTVGTSLQVAYALLAKKGVPTVSVIVTFLKYALGYGFLIWQTWYMFTPNWIGEICWTDFHSSIYATLIYGVFYLLLAACAVVELVLEVYFIRRKRKNS